jgi:hypothetical protein
LINDLTRFWRTMTVDFGAKRWRALAADWLLRYAKLVTTRKILFAGTLASYITVGRHISFADFPTQDARHEALLNYLLGDCEIPPIAKLMNLYSVVNADTRPELVAILQSYDTIVGILGRRGTRSALKARGAGPTVRAIAIRDELDGEAERIQTSLERVFFDDPVMQPLTRRYGLF